jgi:hypothetical protein
MGSPATSTTERAIAAAHAPTPVGESVLDLASTQGLLLAPSRGGHPGRTNWYCASRLAEGCSRGKYRVTERLRLKAAPKADDCGEFEKTAIQKAKVMGCFSQFQIDMSAFKFDQQEANARR